MMSFIHVATGRIMLQGQVMVKCSAWHAAACSCHVCLGLALLHISVSTLSRPRLSVDTVEDGNFCSTVTGSRGI